MVSVLIAIQQQMIFFRLPRNLLGLLPSIKASTLVFSAFSFWLGIEIGDLCLYENTLTNKCVKEHLSWSTGLVKILECYYDGIPSRFLTVGQNGRDAPSQWYVKP